MPDINVNVNDQQNVINASAGIYPTLLVDVDHEENTVSVTVEKQTPLVDVQVIATGPVGPQGIQGPPGADGVDGQDGAPGADGADGVSPVISSESITGGHRLTIVDAGGTTTVDVMDGQDGQDGTNGTNGTDGQDGVSPEVSIASITGGHSVTITDADHPTGQTFNVMDGQNGSPGTPGAAATIAVGTVTTGDPDDPATVTNAGTSSAAVFNFTIPKGDKGDTGSTGPAGPGVPAGGNAGQILAKNSATDYDVHWVNKTQDYPSAYCTTAAATAAKKASCSLWVDTANSYLHVLIGQANTSAGAITLNVNSTGAKPVYINGEASSATNYTLPAGSYIVFYDGTNFHFRTDGELPADISGSAGSAEVIPWGKIDNTSTATVYTATIPGITKLVDGTSFWLKNGVIASASGFTVNINNLGAKKCYNNMTAATQDTTIFNINYTMLFVYDSSLDSGAGGYYIYRGYDANTNTIGYQIRTNSFSVPMTSITYRYRLLFQSADKKRWVPANNSTSTNATTARSVCQDPINPLGPIVYYGTTASVAAGSRPSAANLWQEYTFNLGYSFQKSPNYSLTEWKPVYLKCAPQSDGSAIIDSTTPFVQDLPTTEDGKLYILLGFAYSTTSIELVYYHPVYWYKGGRIRHYTDEAPELPAVTSVDNGKFLVVDNGAWTAMTLSTWQGGSY